MSGEKNVKIGSQNYTYMYKIAANSKLVSYEMRAIYGRPPYLEGLQMLPDVIEVLLTASRIHHYVQLLSVHLRPIRR